MGNVWCLTWSPDGRQLIVSAENSMGGSVVLRVDVVHRRVLQRYSHKMGYVAWRPDGKYLLCTWTPRLYGTTYTQLRRPNGSAGQDAGPEPAPAVYSPDGRHYAFPQGGSLMRADGNGRDVQSVKTLTTGQVVYSCAWR